MTNEEIDIRLKMMSQAIPKMANERYAGKQHYSARTDVNSVAIELELLNMNVMTVWVMLGEIAKRLPEQKEPRSMSDDHADLIESMREKRIDKGLSIRALAEQIGVSFSALARLERGIGSPDSNTQARILNWLELKQ